MESDNWSMCVICKVRYTCNTLGDVDFFFLKYSTAALSLMQQHLSAESEILS